MKQELKTSIIRYIDRALVESTIQSNNSSVIWPARALEQGLEDTGLKEIQLLVWCSLALANLLANQTHSDERS